MFVKSAARRVLTTAMLGLAIGAVFPPAALARWKDSQISFEDRISPEVGKRRVIAPGETLADFGRYQLVRGARLDTEPVTPARIADEARFRSGMVLRETGTMKAFKACGPSAGAKAGDIDACLIDDDGDGTFDRMASSDIGKAFPLDTKVPYEVIPEIAVPINEGLTKRLLYQGVSQGELKLSYREFINGLARDAFSEELTIPLSGTFPQKAAAKGIIVTIYGVDALGLDYELTEVRPGMGWEGT